MEITAAINSHPVPGGRLPQSSFRPPPSPRGTSEVGLRNQITMVVQDHPVREIITQNPSTDRGTPVVRPREDRRVTREGRESNQTGGGATGGRTMGTMAG